MEAGGTHALVSPVLRLLNRHPCLFVGVRACVCVPPLLNRHPCLFVGVRACVRVCVGVQASKREVLFVYNAIDDFVFSNLQTYNKRSIKSAETSGIDLGGADEDDSAADAAVGALTEEEVKNVQCARLAFRLAFRFERATVLLLACVCVVYWRKKKEHAPTYGRMGCCVCV